MGGGRWSAGDWKDYTTRSGYTSKSTTGATGIYSGSSLDPDLDPKAAVTKPRESCDSKDNPLSTALITALDVTGSMRTVLDVMARKGMNTLVTNIYDRKPVTDPHIMCMGIGDAEMGDRAPLQVTQFEADIRIAKQLEKLYLEGGGGGNNYESYALAWWFAAKHTTIDCFKKRGKKGYLFTIGDEEPTPYLRANDIERVLGYAPQADIQMDELLTLVSRQWEVFHVIVEEGDHASRYPDRVRKKWTDALGQRVLTLPDHTRLAEVIVSAIQINEGEDADKVASSWDGTTSIVVKAATKGIAKKSAAAGGIVSL